MRFERSYRPVSWVGVIAAVLAVALLGRGRAAPSSDAVAASNAANPIGWDATEKTLHPKLGDDSVAFQFTATNSAKKPVTIEEIRPTCGCTVAEMPAQPWVLAPGASGTFIGTVDIRGKEGTVSKSLFVNSTAGTQMLTLTIKIPTLDDAARLRNQRMALANRQAVFQGDCAVCHLKPAVGRSGAELFTAACGVCHFAANRASMVPDLLTARQHRDAEFWRKWISEGKEGTLMPAWSKDHGGPLTRGQIDSLVDFAMATLPTEPPPPAAVR